MKQTFVTFLFLSLSLQLLWGQEQILPVPSTQPSPAQQKQIARKYGMFIHFGINTFHDQEWTESEVYPFCSHPFSLHTLRQPNFMEI